MRVPSTRGAVVSSLRLACYFSVTRSAAVVGTCGVCGRRAASGGRPSSKHQRTHGHVHPPRHTKCHGLVDRTHTKHRHGDEEHTKQRNATCDGCTHTRRHTGSRQDTRGHRERRGHDRVDDAARSRQQHGQPAAITRQHGRRACRDRDRDHDRGRGHDRARAGGWSTTARTPGQWR